MPEPPDDELTHIFVLVGMMTLTWAWAENCLAIAIGIIDQNAQGLDDHAELPVSLKRRLKYLKRALRQVPALQPLQERGTALVQDFTKLKVRRGELVHGAAWQLEEGGFQSLVLSIKGRQQAITQKPFKIEDAISFNIQVSQLRDDAAAFLLKVAGAIGG